MAKPSKAVATAETILVGVYKYSNETRKRWKYVPVDSEGVAKATLIGGVYLSKKELPDNKPDTLEVTVRYTRALPAVKEKPAAKAKPVAKKKPAKVSTEKASPPVKEQPAEGGK